jgi:hypothetical protein
MQADSFLPSVWGTQLLTKSLSLRPVRTLLRDILKKRMYLHLVKQNPLQFPANVQQDKYALISAVVSSLDKGLDRGLIGPIAQRRLAEILVGKIYIKSNPRFQEFTEKYGWHPPGFITLSPTARCNLTCPGCYAACETNSPLSRRAKNPPAEDGALGQPFYGDFGRGAFHL